jgi:hypothetical protein
MEVATVPKGDLLTYFSILRRAFGSRSASPQPPETGKTDPEPCDKQWFVHALHERGVGFPPALAVSLMAGRHGWVF